MSDLVNRFEKHIYDGKVSNDELVQIIAMCGEYLNLKTISDYCRNTGTSYNGAKNFRNKVELFGVKFIIDNE